ncbi:hypothetical protein VKT23_013105 [Stygiomarasmius scandens]|uniref:F-box domain-containing protein n=1 Tax=Marasmiellus scandens TaxID=2682957 RepID=A0ABR1J678_9AGAR
MSNPLSLCLIVSLPFPHMSDQNPCPTPEPEPESLISIVDNSITRRVHAIKNCLRSGDFYSHSDILPEILKIGGDIAKINADIILHQNRAVLGSQADGSGAVLDRLRPKRRRVGSASRTSGSRGLPAAGSPEGNSSAELDTFKLKRKLEDLAFCLDGLYGLSSTVRKIPVELLEKIFAQVLASTLQASFQVDETQSDHPSPGIGLVIANASVYAPTRDLSQVCSLWRSILLSRPVYWTWINVCLKTARMREASCLFELYLKRSCLDGCPQYDGHGLKLKITTKTSLTAWYPYINVNLGENSGHRQWKLLEQLLATSARWQVAELDLNTEMEEKMRKSCYFNLKRLEEMVVTAEKFWTSFPTLENSYLKTVNVTATCDGRRVATFLSKSPMLQVLELHCENTLCRLYPPVEPVTCVSLSCIHVHTRDSENLEHLFSILTAPSLTKVALYEVIPRSNRWIISFLNLVQRSSCSLRELILDASNLTELDLLLMLQLTPKISLLSLQADFSTITDRLFVALSRLRNLADLRIDITMGSDSVRGPNPESIAAMIESWDVPGTSVDSNGAVPPKNFVFRPLCSENHLNLSKPRSSLGQECLEPRIEGWKQEGLDVQIAI